MIKEIQIENFKSIQSLNLELGRLNVFIGANGSGKSNILEAIGMGACALEDKLDTQFLESRGIKTTEPKLMRSAFQQSNDTKPIQISFYHDVFRWLTFKLENDNGTYSEWWNSGVHINVQIAERIKEYGQVREDNGEFRPYNDLEKSQLLQSYESMVKKTGKRALGVQGINDFLIFSPENSYLQRFEDSNSVKPLGIKGEGLFKLVASIAKEKPKSFKEINENLYLLDWFDGFEIPNNLMFTERRIKIKDRNLEDGLQYFDQRSANEGFLYLLFYLTLFISDETPKFFAIDNIDNAINPKLGSELIKVLAKLSKKEAHDKQVILTTHNPSVLDGLDLSDDDQRLFVVSRNKSGHTKVLRVPYRETDERLSYSFIRGSIGGLPKNF